MNTVGKFAVMCRKEGIKQLGVVLHMVHIWSKHIRLYSAGIFLLCSSENPLFFFFYLSMRQRWLILNFVRLNFPSSNGSKSLNFCCPDWFYVLSWFFRWLTVCLYVQFFCRKVVFLFHGPSLQVLYLISLPQVLFSFLYTYYYPSAVYEFDFFLFNWIDGHSELYTLLLDKVHVCTTFCVLNFLGS